MERDDVSSRPPGALWFEAADRNKQPICEALRGVLPATGTVVEIASGGGQHAAYFSGEFPHLTWQPTEPDAERRASIEAWRRHVSHPNLRAPIALDVEHPWPVTQADALYLANLLHVSRREASSALLRGAAQVLAAGAPLCVYGPFTRQGAFTTPSNARFDQTVKSWHPDFGIRDLEELAGEATALGLVLDHVREMPANNFFVVWRRT
jgi:hypothetical protein